MLIFNLTRPDLLIILLILMIFLGVAVRNTSLISSMLIYEACTYNFLLVSTVDLLVFNLTVSGEKVDLRALEATKVKYDATYCQNVLFLAILR